MNEIDTEMLIYEVRARPALWDTSSEGFKDRHLKREQWQEVFYAFYPHFNLMTPEEQVVRGREIQARWRNIRDVYWRFLRSKKKVKTYVYARHLQFLKLVLAPNLPPVSGYPLGMERTGQVEDFDGADVKPPMWKIQPKLEQTDNTPINDQRRRKLDTIEVCPDTDYMDCLPDKKSRTGEASDDMEFFRSLLPALQPLPVEEKIKFRIDVMKLALAYGERNINQTQ